MIALLLAVGVVGWVLSTRRTEPNVMPAAYEVGGAIVMSAEAVRSAAQIVRARFDTFVRPEPRLYGRNDPAGLRVPRGFPLELLGMRGPFAFVRAHHPRLGPLEGYVERRLVA